MNLSKKVFKIGKYEIEQWQVILGAVASLLAIVSFFRKPKGATETPYSLNVTPSSSGSSSDSGGSTTASPAYGTSNYMDSSLSDSLKNITDSISDIKTTVNNQNSNINDLNSKVLSNSETIGGINNKVDSLKSQSTNTENIASTVKKVDPIISVDPAPIAENHDTSAVVPTIADKKVNTSTAVNTAQSVDVEKAKEDISKIKSGTPVTDKKDWNNVVNSIKNGSVTPSKVPPSSSTSPKANLYA